MTATPRTIRPVALPPSRLTGARTRLRRAPGDVTRPFGAVSLFLAATGILGLTSVFYLSQSGQATTAALKIPQLQAQLSAARNTTAQLRSQVYQLTAPNVVMQAAKQYGMTIPTDTSAIAQITVPGQVVTRVVVMPAATHRTPVHVPLTTTNLGVTSWWQNLWVALYNVMH